MTETSAPSGAATVPAARKGSKLPLLIGLLLAILGGGGGFFIVTSGLLNQGMAEKAAGVPVPDMPDVAFLEIAPILVTLAPDAQNRQLRFRAQVEVAKPHAEEVAALMPRIVDVMNSYLRALEPADFQDPQVLPRLRSQLLRRIQVVTGQGRVKDLLVMEFVLN